LTTNRSLDTARILSLSAIASVVAGAALVVLRIYARRATRSRIARPEELRFAQGPARAIG
jgi:hypothetical protein